MVIPLFTRERPPPCGFQHITFSSCCETNDASGTKRARTAHGLDGSLVKPDWPPLTLDEVRGVLRAYPSSLGKPKKLLTVSPRPFSAASVVETERGQVFVKRHHCDVRDAEGLREEHRFMHHLRANGIGVPRVFTTSSGQTAIESGEWTYEVHESPPASTSIRRRISWTPFRSVEHARSAGECWRSFIARRPVTSLQPDESRPLVASFTIFASPDPQAALDRYLAARPALKSTRKLARAARKPSTSSRPFMPSSCRCCRHSLRSGPTTTPRLESLLERHQARPPEPMP